MLERERDREREGGREGEREKVCARVREKVTCHFLIS
jgi:hypothetical protein